jgi:hypothetical protein
MSKQSTPLPDAWVERLFARFVAIYGSQKVGAMWVDAPMVEVKELWAEQLGRFEPASIGLAMQRVIDRGIEWPPTLPEFVELCRQSAIARAQSASPAALLPRPGDARTDIETARQRLREIRDLAKRRQTA